MSYQHPVVLPCSCGRRMAYAGVDIHKPVPASKRGPAAPYTGPYVSPKREEKA